MNHELIDPKSNLSRHNGGINFMGFVLIIPFACIMDQNLVACLLWIFDIFFRFSHRRCTDSNIKVLFVYKNLSLVDDRKGNSALQRGSISALDTE